MILESPLRPVLEGDHVTLRCSFKQKGDENLTTDFPTYFFKDGKFIGVEKLGRMTLTSVAKSHDEGFYKCKHLSHGESNESWLEVKGEEPLDCLTEAVRTGDVKLFCPCSDTVLHVKPHVPVPALSQEKRVHSAYSVSIVSLQTYTFWSNINERIKLYISDFISFIQIMQTSHMGK